MIVVAIVMMKIAVMVAIPSVIVFHAAVIAFPIAREKLPAIVTRTHPVSAFIRRTRPVTRVPAIPAVHRILITVHPHITGAGRRGTDRNDAWRRGRANAYPNANLSA
jgi:hypothetical protein